MPSLINWDEGELKRKFGQEYFAKIMEKPNSPRARRLIKSYRETVKEFDKKGGTNLYPIVDKLL